MTDAYADHLAFRLLFHVHTRASFDSLMSPRTILQHCRKHDIHAVAICDHDSIDGSRKAATMATTYGVQVIPAVEYATSAGDIIGLFVHGMPGSDEVSDVLHYIRQTCGGLAVLPHPFRGHDLDRIPMEQIDIVETANARCSTHDNHLAEQLARKHGKPIIAGADAHVAGELANALNTFTTPAPDSTLDAESLRSVLLSAPRTIHCDRTPVRYSAISRIIKGIKKRRPATILNAGTTLLREEARRRLWRFAERPGTE